MLKQRKSQARKRCGYPVLISIDFDDFTSPFTLSVAFVSIEKIQVYQTMETVFHRLSKHLAFCQKILCSVTYFHLSSQCLDIPFKHLFLMLDILQITWTVFFFSFSVLLLQWTVIMRRG